MLKYIVLTSLSLVTSLNAAAGQSKSVKPLSACGGRIEVERSDLQTVVSIKDVVRCPYVVFENERQSMMLKADGRYEHFYVWHQASKQDLKLNIAVHTAAGSVKDTVDLVQTKPLTAQLETSAALSKVKL